jgi:hypothetical protein
MSVVAGDQDSAVVAGDHDVDVAGDYEAETVPSGNVAWAVAGGHDAVVAGEQDTESVPGDEQTRNSPTVRRCCRLLSHVRLRLIVLK